MQKYANEKDEVLIVTFDRLIEDILSGGLVTTENGSTYLNLDAKNAQDILQKLMKGIQVFDREGTQPILIVSARLRQAFQKLVSRYISQLVVLSYDEIPPDVNVRNLELIV